MGAVTRYPSTDRKELVRETTGKLMIVNIETGKAEYVIRSRATKPEIDSVLVAPIGWAADYELK